MKTSRLGAQELAKTAMRTGSIKVNPVYYLAAIVPVTVVT